MKEIKQKKPLILCLIAFAVLIAGILLVGLLHFDHETYILRIADPRSEAVYYFIKVSAGDTFTLTCRNSVSKSLVTGTFMITEEGLFEPLTTAFTSYGPGLPMDFVENYNIENGIITVFHNEEPRKNIRLWVTPYTEEIIRLNNCEYPLGALADTNLLLDITISRKAILPDSLFFFRF